jgi:hypothetical protein
MVKDHQYFKKIIKNFWSKVSIKNKDDCWLWEAGKRADGYGAAYDGNKSIPAHSMSWKITHGYIPKLVNGRKVLIRHVCNNKLCVNPDHLSIGTYSDNGNDLARTGKLVALDMDEVKEALTMRKRGMTYLQIGKRLGVSSTVISKVDHRKGIYGEIRRMIDLNIEEC